MTYKHARNLTYTYTLRSDWTEPHPQTFSLNSNIAATVFQGKHDFTLKPKTQANLMFAKKYILTRSECIFLLIVYICEAHIAIRVWWSVCDRNNNKKGTIRDDIYTHITSRIAYMHIETRAYWQFFPNERFRHVRFDILIKTEQQRKQKKNCIVWYKHRLAPSSSSI